MKANRTVILHLSDIHFVKGVTGGTYDLDEDVRNELERDMETMLKELGHVDAIVVTGDIAFRAHPEEYKYAADWLHRIGRHVGCPDERIWTIPGNHDADWPKIDENLTIRVLHENLRVIDVGKLNDKLTEFLCDPRIGEELLRPLQAYQDFAAHFGCGFSREKPFWERDLTLNDGSTLRVRGLTSTLVTNRDDDEGEMVLGLAPATLKRMARVEYMVLCHHPLEWFRECEELEKLFTSRARVLLFGHKHIQKLRRVEDVVSVTAGAVHPYRGEKPWQPRYNYIRLSVSGVGAERYFEVEVYPRVWSDESGRFEGELHKGKPSRQYGFEIEFWKVEGRPTEAKSDTEIIVTIAVEAASKQEGGEAQAMDSALTLANRFWRLPYHIRMRLLRELRLIEEQDKVLSEEERVVLAFRRARERGLLGDLDRAVQGYVEERGKENADAGVA